VALATFNDAVVLWNRYSDEHTEIGGLAWCVDLDYLRFGTNFCDLLGDEAVQELLGPIPVLPTDMNEVCVCRNGKSVKTSFPEGLIAQIGQGAELGRCEFLD